MDDYVDLPTPPLFDFAIFNPQVSSNRFPQQHPCEISQTRLDFRREEDNALHNAIIEGHHGLVKFLLENNVDVNIWANGYKPLHLAVSLRNVEITRLLLEHKPSLDIISSVDRGPFTKQAMHTNMSPLHIAAQNGDLHIARALLDAGADVDIVNSLTFKTPLLLAVENQHYEMAELLLEKKAKVEGHYHASYSPLVIAVYERNTRLVQLLCDHGADLNQRDEDGDPAVSTAAAEGQETMVKFLLEVSRSRGGPPLDLQGGSGRPAWWYAERSGHHSVANLLKKAPEGASCREEYSRDVTDDSSRSLGEIGVRRLLDDVSEAQSYLYRVQPAGRPGDWKRRLRFVIKAAAGKPYHFEVVEPFLNGEDDQEPFVAVSYCWASRDTGKKETFLINVPDKSGRGSATRELRVRPVILLKSMEFARSRGINRVWIDQECIHQDDNEDKEILVGSMQRLYRQATLTLVILGDHIRSEDDIRAVKHITDKSYSIKYNETQECSHRLSSRIFQDRWFERAWTTQEALSAGSAKLVYLIGWDQGLDPTGDLWKAMKSSVTSEFPKQDFLRGLILDGNNIWSLAFVPRESPVPSLIFAVMQRQTLVESVQLKEWYSTYIAQLNSPSSNKDHNTPSPATVELQRPSDTNYSTHKQSISESLTTGMHETSITSLLRALTSKRCLMILDRPSILANLARYEHYLNMTMLVKRNPDISYTACILALSLANGDVSLLIDREELSPSVESPPAETSWLAENARLTPRRPISGRTVDGRKISHGSPCLVIKSKLVMKGVLWKLAFCEDLLPLQQDILRMIEYCRDHPMRVRLVGTEVLKSTLKQLFANGKVELVGLFITLARQKGWESPDEYYSTIQQFRKWYYDNEEWPYVPKGYLRGDESSLETDPSCMQGIEILPRDFQRKESILQDDGNPLEIPRIWGDDLLRWIYTTVVRGTPFPVGRFDGSEGKDEREKTSIFNLDIEEHLKGGEKQVFLPMSELNYQFKGERFMEGPASKSLWQVRKAEGAVISKDYLEQAKARLRDMFSQDAKFWPERSMLRVVPTKDLMGIWSPVLCSDGLLEKDDETGIYSMLPLEEFAYYHVFT
ncbi:uncharacterized protein FTOL_10761 [Fusarium torulosum]|uniref:Heterokaryon incompatibility domain-containing protein n=1 Tax=Fusarium torulosum TaxID=33205 RepID=A0AAE8MHX8_9HYPO|nr:uncharacterized protein FTOL_10761 [Fusarium torulosum]